MGPTGYGECGCIQNPVHVTLSDNGTCHPLYHQVCHEWSLSDIYTRPGSVFPGLHGHLERVQGGGGVQPRPVWGGLRHVGGGSHLVNSLL